MGQQYSHLSSEERILIEKLHCEQHLSIRRTAERIGRDKSTVSRELRRGLWFASNENGSYRPYRPKRLKTGPWTSGPFYSALAAQRKADLRRRGSRKPRRMDSDRLRAWVLDSLRRCISSSRCFVFSHVFFSGLGSCMHFPYFSGCAEVFLPNMRASLTRRLWPVNSRSRPWCTMRAMIAAASLSSAKTVPHLLNSMFVVNMMLRLS